MRVRPAAFLLSPVSCIPGVVWRWGLPFSSSFPGFLPMNYFRSKRFLDTLPDWERGDVFTGNLEDYLPRMRALLGRLDNPQQRYRSVIVGGTNGKGTVGGLLAGLLGAAGRRVGFYSSPHLHSVRERIRIDDEVMDKDLWAEGVAYLYEKSRDFEREGYGPFSKFEALTALGAYLFAQEGVDYGVFEVGLGGRYDATNAWDAELAVLTAVQLDHTQVLGETLEAIAADKFHISRPGRPLFTTAAQMPEVLDCLRQQSADRGVDLYVVGRRSVDGPAGKPAVTMPPLAETLPDRPGTYPQNIGLALAVGRYLLGEALTDDLVRETVAAHAWPGRFEIARTQPCILLDGAHNPAGAAALAEDLRKRSPRWRFIVGTSAGHDAAGVLQAISPLAAEVVLTRSSHPRAVHPDVLRSYLPEGISVRCDPDGLTTLKRALLHPEGDTPICVMGSLHLVALAREILDLPRDQDGFSEDVILESLRCLEAACENLGLDYTPVSEDGNVVRLTGGGRSIYFLRNRHPFNDYVGARLAEDKAYQYELFTQAGLRMPHTMKVFNPLADARFDRYKTHRSIAALMEEIDRQFAYPVVVKRNQGSMAQGIYLEESREALAERLQDLCENSGYLNNVILVQTFVDGPEYRIVATHDELLLAYEKRNDLSPGQTGDLNPLHQPGGTAVPVTDADLIRPMQALTRALCRVIDLGFYAIDLILSGGEFYILEINPNPICHFYNAHNGRTNFIRIYERLLRQYLLGIDPHLRNE